MANNDYFTIVYKVLSYLKYCYENDLDPDADILQETVFNISQKQLIRSLMMLADDGYIKGLTVKQTKSGTVVGGINQLAVTSSGLQYLAENSMMKKAYKIFKEFRDWAPII